MNEFAPSAATRTGKIARLPRQLREELNRRLADGETGARLIEWLNALPETQAVLAADFGGRPISEQNLSEWKQGGFRDWQQLEEARAWMERLAEGETDLKDEASGLAERLAALALVSLGRLLQEVPLDGATEDQSRRLLEVARRLSQLQRTQTAADLGRIQRERWEAEQAAAREKKEEKARWKEKIARESAVLFPHLDADGLPKPRLTPEEIAQKAEAEYPQRKPRCDRGFARGPRKSNLIKPDQTSETLSTAEISSQSPEATAKQEGAAGAGAATGEHPAQSTL